MKKEYGTTYKNVFYQPGANPVFSYRTGLTVYEETFTRGMLVSSGWNAAGYPLNVLTNCPSRINPDCFTEPQAFRLDADGETADSFLEFSDFTTEDDGGNIHAKLVLLCPHKNLRITVHTILDGSPCFTRYLEITNLSGSAEALNKLAVISGGLEVMGNYMVIADGHTPDEFYSLGYMDNTSWEKEGNFNWHKLPQDKTTVSGRFLRERHRHPMFILKNQIMGTSLIAQFAWSGGFDFEFDYNTCPEDLSTRLAFSMLQTCHSPMLLLEPGETYVTPEVYIGIVVGDEDDAINSMNEHLRKTVLVATNDISSKMLVGAGMGPEHDMSVETTKNFMDQMAYIGCDVFIVDAGWYNEPHQEMSHWWSRVGNWYPNPNRYPNGLEEIVDYCHSKGMKFGMWMESERIAAEEIVKQHPDWFPIKKDGSVVGTFVDFTNPEAAAWVESEVTRVISTYKLDLFRVDYNVGTDTLLGFKDKNGRKEFNMLRHIQAVYKMYRNLKKKFPNVIFENCAGGGGRTDLGQIAAFNHTWVSDNQKAPRSFYITNGMTMAIPPERVDRLVAGMGCHSYASLDFQMRNAMFGHLTMNVFSPAAAEINPQQLEFIRHSISLYKEFARPLIPTCRIFHHTPTTSGIQETGFGIIENASPEMDKAMIGVFSFPGQTSDSVTVYPRGISPEGSYEVYFDNSRSSCVVSGYSLVNDGIKVRIPSALSSELIIIKRA